MKRENEAPLFHDPENNPTGLSALDWPHRAGTADEIISKLNVLAARRRRRRVMGFTALVAAMFGLAGAHWHTASPLATSNSSATPVVVVPVPYDTLPDGSTVDLKSGAEIEVAYTSRIRAVTLKHGTARFQVAKNPRWPFVVKARGITVRAVGTVFCVGVESKSVEVFVTEGKVAVAQLEHDPKIMSERTNLNESALVGRDEHVVVADATDSARSRILEVTTMRPLEMADKLAWLNPRLEFTGTPLDMVILAFNKHNRRQLVLLNPELRSLQLSGTLRSDNLPALLHMLETDFHIQTHASGNGEILLYKTR